MISVSNLSVHFTGTNLFESVSFLVNDRDRIGLVGKNGAGKTTLLNILAGELEPESGTVASPSGSTIGYLRQESGLSSELSVLEETKTAFREANELHDLMITLEREMELRPDHESESYSKLILRYNEANDRYHFIGGHTALEDAEKVLKGLGFETEDFDKPLRTFSGGWQMRVELAKILLQRPDALLLDEPTNHLDIESIQWLEEYLENYPGAVVLVSHDRTFLDKVTTRTIEIMNGRIYDYKAGYSDYIELRNDQLEQQRASFNNQQAQIAQIERFIERFRYKSTKARQVQSRVKMLEKMDRVEVDSVDSSAIHFQFPPAPRSGKVVVEARDLTKKFGQKLVLQGLEFIIEQGDFIAFVGRNGEGKTTLSKIITGNLDHEGECRLGHNVEIGYYAQNQAELLDPERTVFQTIDDVAVGEIRSKIRAILGSFLFDDEAIDKKVKVLSGGEKARLALARMLLKPVNLLVLDEPTNHLDMISKDILKNALLKYNGTLIIVSHDRDFLQGLTDKVYEFRNHQIKVWIGDVFDFLQSRKLESLKELNLRKTGSSGNIRDDSPSDQKVLYEKRKQQEREIRKAAAKVQKCEEEISRLEAEISRYDRLLAEPDSHSDAAKSAKLYKEYQQLRTSLDEKMEEWAVLHEEWEQTAKDNE